MRILALGLALSAAMAAPVAAVTYKDGGTTTVSGPSDYIVVSKSTTLILVDGADVDPGVSGLPSSTDVGITASKNSVVSVTGGSVIGAQNNYSGARGIEIDSSTLMVSGGTIDGGTGSSRSATAVIIESGTFVGTGGTIKGGERENVSSATYGGDALEFYDTYAQFYEGITVIGGAAQYYGGDALAISGNSTVIDIFGGTFIAGAVTRGRFVGDAVSFAGGATVNLYGGIFDGAFKGGAANILNVFGNGLSYADSVLSGTLYNGDEISVTISGSLTVNLFEGWTPTTVPLPASVWLGVGGLAALASVRGRRLVADKQD